ncbi:MAG: cyclase family protein, partial [Proteobacteria bacterium]|nr:cyclase family protein [Pseudomonadota bacterium]
EVALDKTVGAAAVIDLSGIAPETEITAEALAGNGAHLEAGDIAIVKTCWDQARSPHTPAFWTEAPYLSAAACRWLLARGIKALGVDFPQDYPIRLLLEGKRAPIAEFVSHDILLRNGVILIEYLCNLGALQGPRTTLFALPLKVPGADGAPARVIAYESEDRGQVSGIRKTRLSLIPDTWHLTSDMMRSASYHGD